MEFIDGIPLYDYIRQPLRISFDVIYSLLVQVLSSIAVAQRYQNLLIMIYIRVTSL